VGLAELVHLPLLMLLLAGLVLAGLHLLVDCLGLVMVDMVGLLTMIPFLMVRKMEILAVQAQ
jgi:hypothetical protein